MSNAERFQFNQGAEAMSYLMTQRLKFFTLNALAPFAITDQVNQAIKLLSADTENIDGRNIFAAVVLLSQHQGVQVELSVNVPGMLKGKGAAFPGLQFQRGEDTSLPNAELHPRKIYALNLLGQYQDLSAITGATKVSFVSDISISPKYPGNRSGSQIILPPFVVLPLNPTINGRKIQVPHSFILASRLYPTKPERAGHIALTDAPLIWPHQSGEDAPAMR